MGKIIAVINDIHAGSDFALHPPNAETSSGPCPQNEAQKHLWKCWLDATNRLRYIQPDYIVINGDVIDGDQFKENGAKVRSQYRNIQVDWAEQILRMLPKPKVGKGMYFVHGTPYHDGRGGEYADLLASRFVADNIATAPNYKMYLSAKNSYHYLDLNIDGVILNFLHEIPVGGALYRGVAIDREMIWSALAGKTGKAEKADAVIRSHAHYFVHIEHASKHGVITPCWQLPTTYTMRKSAYRMMPDIGFVLIHVDGESKKMGRDPIRVEKFLYPLPSPKVVVGGKA